MFVVVVSLLPLNINASMLIWFEHVYDLGRVNFPEYGNSECVSLGEIQITNSHHNGDHDRHRSSRHRRSRSRSNSHDRNREGRGDGDGRGGSESVLDMDSKVLYNKVSSSVSPEVNSKYTTGGALCFVAYMLSLVVMWNGALKL